MRGRAYFFIYKRVGKFGNVNDLLKKTPYVNTWEQAKKLQQEFVNKVKSDLEVMFARDSDFLFKREFAKKITASIDPKLPDAFLKRYIQITNEKPVTEEMVEHDYPFYAAQLRWELIEGKIIRKYALRVSQEDAIAHVKQVLASRYAQYGLPMQDEMLVEFAKQTLAKKEEAKNVYDFLYEEKLIELAKEKCSLNVIEIDHEEFIRKVQQN